MSRFNSRSKTPFWYNNNEKQDNHQDKKEIKILNNISTEMEVDATDNANDTIPGDLHILSESQENPHLSTDKDAIAIIGISGKYPGASSIDEYWENLLNGRNCINEIPSTRWDIDKYYDGRPNQPGKTYSKWMGSLDGVDLFDPLFFNISPSEAEGMDPQQRLFLQEAYLAFENAGYTPKRLSNKHCGVYLGIMSNEYSLMMYKNGSRSLNTTGTSYAIAAARIAYFLNLKGPAISIDTACSSSLVATHLGCQALLNHEIDMALIGGVTNYLLPESYIGMCSTGMLAPDGKCKVFDNSANGFVPGEGVGAFILKRLKDAQTDGDQIYGLIIESAINQDGKTNGITAPSMNSQMELERKLYNENKIHPETISYVEMHGTGTQLGDPIELEALSTVFKEMTSKRKYCGIGSVKSNIGHTSAAAGVASIQKVLLCLKNKTLVPTLHYKNPNEHFDFENSPFYVNTEVKKWDTQEGTRRRASVSSFGFSGTNAHVIIEEYIQVPEKYQSISKDNDKRVIIPISAKSKEQLKVLARDLRDYIKKNNTIEPKSIAYTLQIGRDEMEVRSAFVAGSLPEIISGLQEISDGKKEPTKVSYSSRGTKNNHEIDQDACALVENWILNRKFETLAQQWEKGREIGWNRLYSAEKLHCIHLPGYPFAKESYWAIDFPDISKENGCLTTELQNYTIHPLLHRNTSDLTEQRFSSIFTGQTIFLKDHIVDGYKLLPGVAHLEMALEALVQSGVKRNTEKQCIRFKNILWERPVTVSSTNVTVHTGIQPEASNIFSFRIYSGSGIDGQTEVYSQGIMELTNDESIGKIELDTLQRECSGKVLESFDCYRILKKIGIDYGEGLQGIDKIFIGKNKTLAKLKLPENMKGEKQRFSLHPTIMDSAFQATIGLFVDAEEESPGHTKKAMVPFAVQEMEILGKSERVQWAFIELNEGSAIGDSFLKTNIQLFDENGVVCVRIKGLSYRTFDPNGKILEEKILLLFPSWIDRCVRKSIYAAEYTQRLVVLCGWGDLKVSEVQTFLKDIDYSILPFNEKTIDHQFEWIALEVFGKIKKMLSEKHPGRMLMQIVFPSEQRLIMTGLSGLLQSSRHENPNFIGQMIEVASDMSAQNIRDIIEENSLAPNDHSMRYSEQNRKVIEWKEVHPEQVDLPCPWKENGIYLITGGLGGIGRIILREINTKVKKAFIIVIGRSPNNGALKTHIEELRAEGINIDYRQVDVTKAHAVKLVIKDICEKYGTINGILHSAGINQDNYIIKKEKEEFKSVLEPKVTGIVNLDNASKNIDLDFFIMFSSIAAVIGNIGQADYSTANAFMDAYSEYRNALQKEGKRQGRTLSINWPLWQDGGMHSDTETESLMSRRGLQALDNANGIDAFYKSLYSQQAQIMVISGNQSLLDKVVSNITVPNPIHLMGKQEENDLSEIIEEDTILRTALEYLKEQIASVLRIPKDRLEDGIPMEKYGIDSITVLKLTNVLEKDFGQLSKTLFFEYQTIRELAVFFVTAYGAKLIELRGLHNNSKKIVNRTEQTVSLQETINNSPKKKPYRIHYENNELVLKQSEQHTDIAIIGLSGKYPGAANMDEFWRNLRDGIDSITEIPKERWDYFEYKERLKKEANKLYCKWGGFLDEVDKFDPLFFNISPREAMVMDPQERLFLECVYKTLEDAGYSRDSFCSQENLSKGANVGVFVGVMYEEYQLYGVHAQDQGDLFALSGNPSSIANRVSYFFNFHGPSIAVDTMCSSSLTAIHLAINSLQREECEVAIAGGVNVSIHPNKYLSLAMGGFTASNGRCYSFGQGGDGYVPGEGVGAIILKPIARAIADGDNIYGIIKASAINHGGKTNGYTVPNPVAQAAVISKAIKESKIDTRTISYLEAHGTGTSLGDPIEITGLTKAFSDYTDAKQFCAIGSVKSNIGHCESAAGIAGITKILLQMKYGEIVPSLHSEVLNSNIDFEKTPFYVQQKLTEWKRPVIDNIEYPRRAGLSSFGAGGGNAHLIIEEYSRPEPGENLLHTGNGAFYILLSAKTHSDLIKVVQWILQAIENAKITDSNLKDVAYTLQVGREAMEERLAISVKTVTELSDKLEMFLGNKDFIEGLQSSNIDQNKETLSVIKSEGDFLKIIDTWIKKGMIFKLVNLWVKGFPVNWADIYSDSDLYKVSLPTYPFSRQAFWVPWKASINVIENTSASMNIIHHNIHPLVHRNISDAFGLRFSSVLSDDGWFYSVFDQKIFSEGASLEMAMFAAFESNAFEYQDSQCLKLTYIKWCEEKQIKAMPLSVSIGLDFVENDRWAFKIDNTINEKDSEGSNYCNGFISKDNSTAVHSSVDLDMIQSVCNGEVFSFHQCYDRVKQAGGIYSALQTKIENIYLGEGKALVRLDTTSTDKALTSEFHLHPSFLSASVVAAGFIVSQSNGYKLLYPGALKELIVYQLKIPAAFLSVRVVDSDSTSIGGYTIDVDVISEQGKMIASIYALELCPFKRAVLTDRQSGEVRTKKYLKKHWVPCIADKKSNIDGVVAILTSDQTINLAQLLSQKLTQSRVMNESDFASQYSWNEFGGVIDLAGCGAQKSESLEWLLWIQKLIVNGNKSGIMLLCVSRNLELNESKNINLSGALQAGFYRMLQSEYSHIRSRHMDTDLELDDVGLVDQIMAEFESICDAPEILYRKNVRYQAFLQEMDIQSLRKKDLSFPEDKVLWITGGTRGLGYLCAEHFVEKYGVRKLVLSGIEPLPPVEQWEQIINQNDSLLSEKLQRIRRLQERGVQVLALSVCLSDYNDMEKSVHQIITQMGKIGGVIHCAGVNDSKNPAFIRKSLDGMQRVFDPKISGLAMILQHVLKEPLQFCILFSSVSSIIPSLAVGQSDYAAANAYLDYTATANATQCPIVSIQWPNWKDTGMGEAKGTVVERTGLLSITNHEGLEFLDDILCNDLGPVVLPAIVNGINWTPNQLMNKVIVDDEMTGKKIARSVTDLRIDSTKSRELTAKVQEFLVEVFSKELMIDSQSIDVQKAFQDYGVDSILLAQIVPRLKEVVLVEIDPSIFFEYPTIKMLGAWLINEHENTISRSLGVSNSKNTEATVKEEKDFVSVQKPARKESSKRPFFKRKVSADNSGKSKDIAVVGLSCRFPGASNIDQYWSLLSEGKSAIQQVPDERWGMTEKIYAGLLEDYSTIDLNNFYISDQMAETMDPQALLLLEEALKVISHAGYTRQELKGKRVGVYIGARSQYRPSESLFTNVQNPTIALGQNYLAANISRTYDLKGPSLVVDTACSSSLVGMKIAMYALQNHEIESAIVGGINLLNSPDTFRLFQKRGILAQGPDFHIFDQRVSGIVLGEGVGMVMIKTLDQACEDGDQIYAVIKAMEMNNDGSTAGPASPNLQAQKDVLEKALKNSGKNADEIQYIEANGSGSEVTDLLELKVIQSIFRPEKGASICHVGAVKPNIGHTLCAEGIASFIKVVQMLHKKEKVPFLSGQVPMTHFNLDSSNFRFIRNKMAWEQEPQVAAINCFADGGTNVSVIVEAKPNYLTQMKRREPIYPSELILNNRKSPGTISNSLIESNDFTEPENNGQDYWGLVDVDERSAQNKANSETVESNTMIWENF